MDKLIGYKISYESINNKIVHYSLLERDFNKLVKEVEYIKTISKRIISIIPIHSIDLGL